MDYRPVHSRLMPDQATSGPSVLHCPVLLDEDTDEIRVTRYCADAPTNNPMSSDGTRFFSSCKVLANTSPHAGMPSATSS